jgi:hypothetical protein
MSRQRREDRYREEAERLAQQSSAEQRRALARIRALADDANALPTQRAQQRERAAALEWLLQRLNRSPR